MAQADVLYHALNAGVADDDNLHRIDLSKMRLSAEIQTNLIPLATGKAFLRPGLEHIANAQDDQLDQLLVSFDAGAGAGYILEFRNSTMRVIDGDTDELITRDAVSTTVGDGDFSSSASWTLSSDSGQTSTIASGQLELNARARGATAYGKQTISISVADSSVIHALRIVVTRGPVLFRLGTTNDGDELIQETLLERGVHSLAFDPAGATSAYIKLFTQTAYKVIVDSCQIEGSGVLTVPTQWETADLPYIHTDQSLDVMYAVAGGAGIRSQKIERRGNDAAAGLSWSVCDYRSDDGPFYPGRTARVQLKPNFTEGDIQLTADKPFFTANMVGTLFKLWHTGQRIDTYLAGDNQYTPTFLMTGITETNFEERKYAYTISGTWSGTLRNFRSFDGEDTGFHQYRREQSSAVIDITANASYTNDDNDDNALVWVRFGFDDGTYTSGEAHIISIYNGGGGYGIARITAVTNTTTADAQVLSPFYGVTYTEEWQEGMWGERGGYPSGVALKDGRLCFGGSDRFWGSISDAYTSFDEEFDGDAGPINRSIALKGRNTVQWMLGTDAMLIGCNTRVVQARGSSLEEILTPSNVNMINVDKVPCSEVPPVELRNGRVLFSAGNRSNLYELNYSTQAGTYLATKFSMLTDKVFLPGVRQLAVTSFPDQRIWAVMDDGTAAMILYEPLMDIVAVIPITLRDGDTFEGVAVLPGLEQDRVYFATRRSIGGNLKRRIEKLALDSEAKPITVSKCMDGHVVFGSSATGLITGLDHLEGEYVVVWADGAPLDTLESSETSEFSSQAYETDSTLWTHDFTSVSSGFADPEHGTSAERVLETVDNGPHDIGIGSIDLDIGSYRMTMTVKAIGGRDLQIGVFDNGFASGLIYRIDTDGELTNGSYGSAYTPTSAEAVTLGDGWYEVTVDFRANAATPGSWMFLNTINGGSSFVGDVTKGFYFYEATLRRLTNTSGITKEFVVAGGQVQLDNPVVTGGCAGLTYSARFKSSRLVYGADGTSPFFSNKVLGRVGFTMADFVRSGLKFGWVFDNDDHPLHSLPEIKQGTTAVDVNVGVDTDEHMNSISSSPNTEDPRLCFEITAPKCATVLNVVMRIGEV